MRKIAAFAFLLLFLPVWVVAQIPPVGSLTVGTTAIADGMNGLCLYQNGTKLGEQACGTGTAQNITVGTTTVTGGSTGRPIYDNAGIVGEMTTTGSGTVAVLQTAPVFLTSVTLPSVAWASIPAPGNAGKIVRVSDAGTKGSLWMDDGTRWKPVSNNASFYTLDTPSSGINGSETIVAQYQLPSAIWQVGDRIRISGYLTKTGTTNTGTFTIRIGTGGTTSDTGVCFGSAVLSAAQHQWAGIIDIILLSATSAGCAVSNQLGYGSSTTNSVPGAATISNVSNALFVNISITGGATDAVILQSARIEYWSSAQ